MFTLATVWCVVYQHPIEDGFLDKEIVPAIVRKWHAGNRSLPCCASRFQTLGDLRAQEGVVSESGPSFWTPVMLKRLQAFCIDARTSGDSLPMMIDAGASFLPTPFSAA